MTFERVGEWIAALAVLAILSLLWRENRFYRVAEHLLLGLTIGFTAAVTWYELLLPKWYAPLQTALTERDSGRIFFGVSAVLVGMCWYGQYFKRTEWLSRIALGVVLGAAAGQTLRNQFTQQVPLLTSSFKSPIVIDSGVVSPGQSVNNTLFLVALISVLCYFFFSVDARSRAALALNRVGRFWLMVGFGVYFGNTIMTRLSVLIERVWFVAYDFVGKMFLR